MTARIAVLWARLADAEAAGLDWTAAAGTLPAAMRQAIAQYHRPDDRRTRLLTRVLLAGLLTDTSLTLADITVDAFGRPHLPGGYDLSVSHTEGLAVVALAHGARIGVDAEAVRAIDPAVYDLALSEAELAALPGDSSADDAFLRLWTAKEAAIKADGRGLSLDIRHVTPTPGGTTAVEGTVFRLHPLPLPPGWIGILAHDAADPAEVRCAPYSFG